MSYSCKIICDSISPAAVRLTTFEITFPRMVLAEFNTHRVFSRNSASSRAIPVGKMLQRVLDDPFIPVHWGKNQKGMQAGQELDGRARDEAYTTWLRARDQAVGKARQLLDIGVHKQITNRLLEPFMWHTVIVTATEWSNFFHLRDNPQAQPEIQVIAKMMREAYESGKPRYVDYGEYHLPFVDLVHDTGEGMTLNHWALVSAARCARVSYLTHDGKRDVDADLELAAKLKSAGHMSPFEHPATAFGKLQGLGWSGNFYGWNQFRKGMPGENDVLGSQS